MKNFAYFVCAVVMSFGTVTLAHDKNMSPECKKIHEACEGKGKGCMHSIMKGGKADGVTVSEEDVSACKASHRGKWGHKHDSKAKEDESMNEEHAE